MGLYRKGGIADENMDREIKWISDGEGKGQGWED